MLAIEGTGFEWLMKKKKCPTSVVGLYAYVLL
jgi:hypothetical protein